MTDKKVFIIMPALNEAEHIRKSIDAVLNNGFSNIIVVDDGSYDETYSIASEKVLTVRHLISRGYGAALSTGTEYALQHGADILVHFDADCQFEADEISAVIRPIIDGRSEVVFGSRYMVRSTRSPLSKKYLIHKPALLMQYVTTGLYFTDIHNGFRALSRDAVERMHLLQDRMAYASEIVSEIKRNKLRYCEVPVTIAYQEYGQNFFGGLKVYADLIKKKILG